jgi:hypothetical protein
MILDPAMVRKARTENLYRLGVMLGVVPFLPANPDAATWHEQIASRVLMKLQALDFQRRASVRGMY